MNLPLSPLTTVLGAAQVAQRAVRRISDAVGFDQVLQSASPQEIGQRVGKLVESIRQRLAGAGIESSGPLQLSLQGDGELRVDSPHDQAAQIEALLNSEQALVDAAREVRQIGGPAALSVDLTSPGAEGNILRTPGGYANWLAD